jgi:drug/metabolite transporter (DMT)-like permease
MTEKKVWRHVLGAGISILGILLLVGCSSSSSNNPPSTTQTFGSTSALGHSHSVVMNRADIDTPPAAGIALVTSSASNHSHSFAMTADQLRAVAGGSTVTVVSGSTDGGAGAHTHSFSIAKWF